MDKFYRILLEVRGKFQEVRTMCYTCGCRRPYDTMGDARNIVEKFFEEAGLKNSSGKEGVIRGKKKILERVQAEVEKQKNEKHNEQNCVLQHYLYETDL